MTWYCDKQYSSRYDYLLSSHKLDLQRFKIISLIKICFCFGRYFSKSYINRKCIFKSYISIDIIHINRNVKFWSNGLRPAKRALTTVGLTTWFSAKVSLHLAGFLTPSWKIRCQIYHIDKKAKLTKIFPHPYLFVNSMKNLTAIWETRLANHRANAHITAPSTKPARSRGSAEQVRGHARQHGAGPRRVTYSTKAVLHSERKLACHCLGTQTKINTEHWLTTRGGNAYIGNFWVHSGIHIITLLNEAHF